MKLKKDLIKLLIPIIITLILVIVKSFDKNSFDISAKDVHEISLEQKHIFSVSDYKYKMNSKENFILVDLRNVEDYGVRHLNGAINLQMNELLENTDIESNRQGIHYIFYSENLAKTTKAWTLLVQKGYKNIYILDITEDLITQDLFNRDSFPSGNEVLKYTFQPDTTTRLE